MKELRMIDEEDDPKNVVYLLDYDYDIYSTSY